MRPGTFSVGLRSTAPALTVRKILDTIDGAGGHIVITPGQMPAGTADATILGLALYTGRIEERPSRGSIEGKGIAAWLGNDDGTTVIETAITKSAATLTTWITDLLVNGITVGTITNTSTHSNTYVYVTYREAIDQVCLATGAEYELRPNFTINAAAPATLFGAPTVVITRKPEGVDGQYRGIEGGLLDQAVTANRQARKIVVVGQAGATGSATNAGLLLKDKAGNAPTLTRLVDAASEPAANLAGLAQATLNLSGVRREFNVSSTSPGVRNYVRPGSYVYVYDVDSGITDPANQIVFRGEVISPLKVRVLSLSWPIERGMGVYLRSNAATPVYTDLSDVIEFDDGDAFWTVGSERVYESSGSVARLGDNPAIATAPLSDTYTPTLVGMVIGTGGSPLNTASYTYADGQLTVEGRIVFGTTGVTYPSTVSTVSLPSGFSTTTGTGSTSYGLVTFLGGGGSNPGTCSHHTTTQVRFLPINTSSTYALDATPSSTIPFAWAAGNSIVYQYSIRAVRA